jgi:hypothetical protein
MGGSAFAVRRLARLSTVLLEPQHSNGALVIYHHGRGEVARAIKDKPKGGIAPLLLTHGYTITACDAAGNNWGNQAGLDEYDKLTRDLAGNFDCLLILAQSMGGISGLLSAIDGRTPKLAGWYGIAPAVNLAACNSMADLRPSIVAAGAHRDPLLIEASRYPVIRYRAAVSYGDPLVQRAENWDRLGLHLPGKPEASTLDATGDHGDSSHFNAADVLAFYERCDGPTSTLP